MKQILGLVLITLSVVSPPLVSSNGCTEKINYKGDLSKLENGYCDHAGRWVPGLITLKTYQAAAPLHTKGSVVWYSEYIMELTAEQVGVDLAPYVDGISLMSCTDFRQVVWLRRPGHNWEGPFIVVDCAKRQDMFSAIYYHGEVAELGYKTANAWGLVETVNEERVVHAWYVSDVEVYKGEQPPPSDSSAVSYPSWWIEQAKFTNGAPIP